MRARTSEPEQPRRIARSWDNTGLRRRVEGKTIEGVDVLALQSSVVAREPERGRRARRRTD